MLLSALIGVPVDEDQLHEAAVQSGVLDVDDDFLEPEFRQECERIVPSPDQIIPQNFFDTFIRLKRNFNINNI